MRWRMAIIPIAILVLPWSHKIFYENVLLAWPNAEPNGVHTGIIIAGCVLTFIVGMSYS